MVDKESVRVKCPSCAQISRMSELRIDQPYRLPNPSGGSWAITYYHCQCEKILIYESGDGGDLVLLEKVKAITAS